MIAGDGSRGRPEDAPFDAIAVTAAAPPEVRDTLADQLAPGGRLVVPVEPSGVRALTGAQDLCLVTKDADGRARTRSVLPVAFVPLVSGGDTAG